MKGIATFSKYEEVSADPELFVIPDGYTRIDYNSEKSLLRQNIIFSYFLFSLFVLMFYGFVVMR